MIRIGRCNIGCRAPGHLCRREARFHGWFDAERGVGDPRRDASRRRLCSRACQDLCQRRRGMIDPTPNEQQALRTAGDLAGEYLDSLSRTDLALLTEAEWASLIEVIVTGFSDSLRALCARDGQHLDRLQEQRLDDVLGVVQGKQDTQRGIQGRSFCLVAVGVFVR